MGLSLLLFVTSVQPSSTSQICALAVKSQRLAGRVDRVVAMAAQLDMNAPRVTDLIQGVQHWREVDVPFAEQQMIVDTAAHVLDVDVP